MSRVLRLVVLAGVCVAVASVAACTEAGRSGEAERSAGERTLVVASKSFTESVILGEVLTQLLASSGGDPGGSADDEPRFDATHRRELGGSRILFNALVAGEIDVYPEYTGTLIGELLAADELRSVDELRRVLADEHGLGMAEPLGFNNTYAIGVARETAEGLGLESLSDLAAHPELRLGFSNEFMDRDDGWPGLRAAYALRNDARGLDHDLAYRALDAGDLDAIDCYSTDAEIEYHDLVTLVDDRGYFPRYDAVVLYRLDLPPRAIERVRSLSGRIDEATMTSMNRLAKIGGPSDGEQVPESVVASSFLARTFALETEAFVEGDLARLWRTTVEHVVLVGLSMLAAITIAIPLGVLAARLPRIGVGVLWTVGILQTVPSLALLVLLIPLFGLGAPTAIAALFLYGLLPIVRNTHAGIAGIPADVRESADAIGLTSWQRLRAVELPMALPVILAGVKTAVVINIGTATLAALIGAGGYGQPILTGIRRDDFALIAFGAIPAALLAIAAQLAFDALERRVVSRGLSG